MQKLVSLFLSLSLLPLLCCTPQSKFEQARSLYEKTYKEHGKYFFRMEEYKTVISQLESIKPSDKDHEKAVELIEKLKDERREYRKESVKRMMKATKARLKAQEDIQKEGKDKQEKPYSEMTEENRKALEKK